MALDDVRIYDKALTDSQVRAVYNGLPFDHTGSLPALPPAPIAPPTWLYSLKEAEKASASFKPYAVGILQLGEQKKVYFTTNCKPFIIFFFKKKDVCLFRFQTTNFFLVLYSLMKWYRWKVPNCNQKWHETRRFVDAKGQRNRAAKTCCRLELHHSATQTNTHSSSSTTISFMGNANRCGTFHLIFDFFMFSGYFFRYSWKKIPTVHATQLPIVWHLWWKSVNCTRIRTHRAAATTHGLCCSCRLAVDIATLVFETNFLLQLGSVDNCEIIIVTSHASHKTIGYANVRTDLMTKKLKDNSTVVRIPIMLAANSSVTYDVGVCFQFHFYYC